MSFVSQDTFLFSDSVFNNMRFGVDEMEGRIIEQGSHYQPTGIEDGIYRRLTELQSVN
jgi:hypothetical protein